MSIPPPAAGSPENQPPSVAAPLASAWPLAAVFSALPSASLLLTPALRIVAASDAYLAVSFTTREQLVGQDIFEAFPGQPTTPAGTTMANLRVSLQQVLATGQPHTMAVQHYSLPNPATPGAPLERYWEPLNTPVLDAHGAVIGLVHTVVNVTERLQAAARLREVQAREQEARADAQGQYATLQRVFEQAPVAITILEGPEHRITLANPEALRLWERSLPQVLGQPYFEALPHLASQGLKEVLADVYHTGQPRYLREEPLNTNRSGTGQPGRGYFNIVGQPLRDAGGRTTGVIVAATEVTEQVLARQQVQILNGTLVATNADLRVINQQLTRTNEDLDNFIYTASHDLWAPISNIEGLLTALRQDLAQTADEAEIQELLDLMQTAVDRFKRTIRDLTDVARLQKAQSQPATPVGLAQLIREVCLDLAPQFAASGAELTVDVDACPNLYFVEKNLRSIVYNLLSNGLKYRHPDRAPHLLVRCYPSDKFVVLTVRDNGLGLDPAQYDKIFDLFQRLHDHVEGSGIGLYMVKKIIENAGGAIEVESLLGEGSTFLVYFPR